MASIQKGVFVLGGQNFNLDSQTLLDPRGLPDGIEVLKPGSPSSSLFIVVWQLVIQICPHGLGNHMGDHELDHDPA